MWNALAFYNEKSNRIIFYGPAAQVTVPNSNRTPPLRREIVRAIKEVIVPRTSS